MPSCCLPASPGGGVMQAYSRSHTHRRLHGSRDAHASGASLHAFQPTEACPCAFVPSWDQAQPAEARSGNCRWTPLEQRELARRKVQLLLYALRSPFFERYTRCAAATHAGWTHKGAAQLA